MPVPFHGVGELARADGVAWLCFVEEGNGGGVRAALFVASPGGDPVGFSFARMGPQESSRFAQDAKSVLAASLFRSCAASPVLLFGAADEISPREFDERLKIALPFCRVRTAPTAGAGLAANGAGDDVRQRMCWTPRAPAPTTEAGAALDRILGGSDPFGPLERAGGALREAFADPRVGTWFGSTGLETVVTLSPLLESASMLTTRGAAQDGAGLKMEGGLAERLWANLAAPVKRPSAEPDAVLEWAGELMPFQRDGVRALLSMNRLLLSDDMGLGKTVQTVAALRILKARGEIASCLAVAPAGLLHQWRREIGKWAPELSAIVIRGSADDRAWQWRAAKDVTLVSYDTLRSDATWLSKLRASKGAWDVVVLDEAQRIKNRNDTSATAKNIPRARSWALTGTPVENREEELASIMEFVDHDPEAPPKRYYPGASLRRRHRELQLRRKKGDVLSELPPKLETRLTIPLHRDQRDSYDRAEHEGIVYLKSLGAEVGVRHVLELITRLKQICNLDPRTGASSKLEDIRERLEELTAQGHKALVFSQYASAVSGVEAAARYLCEFDPLVLTGDTPPERRPDIVERFTNEDAHKAMIVSLRAGGVGLNLQRASYVFHLDRWWNPAVERQAEDRAHRIGQTVKVNVIKYACADTIEERIDRILEEKQKLFDQLVDDVSLDLSARMSRGELLGLFGLD